MKNYKGAISVADVALYDSLSIEIKAIVRKIVAEKIADAYIEGYDTGYDDGSAENVNNGSKYVDAIVTDAVYSL